MHPQRAFRRLVAASLLAWFSGTIDPTSCPGAQPPVANATPESQPGDRLASPLPLWQWFHAMIYPRCPEGTRKLWDILTNAPMPRMFSPGQSRYGWDWLAGRFDADGNGVVSRREFPGPADWFDRLDRNRDGVLAGPDFDWSDRSPLVQRAMMAGQALNQMDGNSNGRISAEEWAEAFAKAAKGKGYLSQEDLQTVLFSSRSGHRPGGGFARQLQRLLAMYRGETSSIFGDAPHVGTQAPDFSLMTDNKKRQIRLSQFRGRRPVVLVFGSFT